MKNTLYYFLFSMPETSTNQHHRPTEAERSAFEQMPPKFAFWAGLVTGTAILSLAAAVILIVFMAKELDGAGGDNDSDSDSSGTVTNTAPTGNTNGFAANTNTNTAPAPTQPTVTGTIDVSKLEQVRGKGDYYIVEYSDFDCPFCKRFDPTIQQVLKDYDGKVATSFKHFPLTSIHPDADVDAMASECAADQGKFWEYHDKLFENQAEKGEAADIAIAEELGLDKAKFEECLKSEKYKDKVAEQALEAQKLGCTGTPCPFIVDKDGKVLEKLAGAVTYETAKAALDKYVK